MIHQKSEHSEAHLFLLPMVLRDVFFCVAERFKFLLFIVSMEILDGFPDTGHCLTSITLLDGMIFKNMTQQQDSSNKSLNAGPCFKLYSMPCFI